MAHSWLKNDPLDGSLVGREESFLSQDLLSFEQALLDQLKVARLLVIGGAGSIGLNTLKTLVRFQPKVVHVVDHNENGLAEVVRTLRSSKEALNVNELLTLPFDYAGLPFTGWVADKTYDYVLNFAALKHVRSEKDPYSILAMLETNVLKLIQLSQQFEGDTNVKRMFCVSTDKAANPSSMMGATKRLMEHAMFGKERAWHEDIEITSARFANVAMSNGSLLQSWRFRLEQQQPMACPDGCKRYFVTLKEAGHLCSLASMLAPSNSIIVPNLNPEEHLVTLQSVAEKFLQSQGYEPYFTRDEAEAVSRVDELNAQKKWPVLLTPLDTAGEKPYEEFVAANESLEKTQFQELDRVPYLPVADDKDFGAFIERVKSMLEGDMGRVDIEMIKNAICDIESDFAASHVSSAKSLDQRI